MIWIGVANRLGISNWQPKSVANLNRVIYLMLMANWMENQPLLQWTSCAVQPPPNIYGIQSVKVRFSEENRIVQVIKYVADFNNYYNWSRQADCNDLDRRTQPILNIHLAADINNCCNRLRQTDSSKHYNRSRQADCDDLQEANRLGIFNWQPKSVANFNRVIYLMLMANWMENQALLKWTSCKVFRRKSNRSGNQICSRFQ